MLHPDRGWEKPIRLDGKKSQSAKIAFFFSWAKRVKKRFESCKKNRQKQWTNQNLGETKKQMDVKKDSKTI